MPTQPPADSPLSDASTRRVSTARPETARPDLTTSLPDRLRRPAGGPSASAAPPPPDLQAIRARLAELRAATAGAADVPPTTMDATPTPPPDVPPTFADVPVPTSPPGAADVPTDGSTIPPAGVVVPVIEAVDASPRAAPGAPADDVAVNPGSPPAVPPPAAPRPSTPPLPTRPSWSPRPPTVAVVGPTPIPSRKPAVAPSVPPTPSAPEPVVGLADDPATSPDAPAHRGSRIVRVLLSAIVIVALLAAMYFLGLGTRTGGVRPGASTSTQMDLNLLQVGDCLQDARTADQTSRTVALVACSTPHNGEVYAIQINGQAYDTTVAEQFCLGAFEGYIGTPAAQSTLDAIALHPLSSGDPGKRITCLVFHKDGSTDTASLRDSRR